VPHINLPRLEILKIKNEQYVRRIISNYSIPHIAYQVAFRVANQLRLLLQDWTTPYVPQIVPTGSLVKGTSIKGTTDIDLLISLPSTYPDTRKDIYRSLADYLKACGFAVREQNVSIGITYKGVSIDLIPAKRQPRSIYDHSIYRRKANTWTKTNVHRHVVLVKQSGRIPEIKAIKIWRNLQGLEFPSFYLELSVINALHGQKNNRISLNLMTIFQYLASVFVDARIVDPSNSNNIISDDLSNKEKQAIAKMADLVLSQPYWNSIIW